MSPARKRGLNSSHSESLAWVSNPPSFPVHQPANRFIFVATQPRKGHQLSDGERRLAAIVYTDIVGYTALSQKSESLAIQLLEMHRSMVRPFFTKHNGREVKTIGDAFLVEFASALEAVRCAFDIQQSMHEMNLGRSPEKLIQLRIGVHVGDVIHSQNDVYGDAVNVASRIYPLAMPGGICVSRQVYDHIRNKFEFPIASLGAKELKNVAEPIEVFKVALPWEHEESGATSTLDPRRIAVLPFVSMSPDPNDEYFADGLTEELITRISLVKGLEVIARTSAMNYKKKEKNASQIGRELKVGTLLEGSVRKAGSRIRVSAQLINANTEGHLWAQNYDRNLEDIFEVQSSVAENVAGALKLKLLDEEKERIRGAGPRNPQAYTEYLRGLYFAHRAGEDAARKSVYHFERAIELEPNYPAAMAWLGLSYAALGYVGYEPMDKMYAMGKELISRALKLDEANPEAHFNMANQAFYLEGDWAKAEREFKRALELNPNFREAHSNYAAILASLGRSDEAITEVEKALQLDPLSAGSHNTAGAIYQLAGRYSEALEHHERAMEMDPDLAHTNYGLTLLAMGRVEEGVHELEKALSVGRSSFEKSNLGYAYAVAGRREDALRIVQELKSAPNRGSVSYGLAQVYAGLGQKEEAINWLEEAETEHDIFTFPMLNIEPFFRSLHAEPSFIALVKRLGLEIHTPVQS